VNHERNRWPAVTTSTGPTGSAVSARTTVSALTNGIRGIGKGSATNGALFAETTETTVAPFAARSPFLRNELTSIERQRAAPSDERNRSSSSRAAGAAFSAATTHAASAATRANADAGGVARPAATTALSWKAIAAGAAGRRRCEAERGEAPVL
jgi:hypothetical protein